MTEKSTKKTSKKVYAIELGLRLVTYIIACYTILELFGAEPSELFFGAALTAVTGLIGTLNIADGMKGHEPNS